MKVTFLGTGTSQGVPVIACDCEVCSSLDFRDKRLRSSVLVEVDGKTLCIDTGPDFRQQLLREQVKSLDAILFTHEHKDHTAGMDDIRAFNYKAQKAMPIYARKSVLNQIQQEFAYIFENRNYPGVPQVDMIEITNHNFEAEGVKIIPIEVLHHKLPVFGFRIKDFTYITDANFISDSEIEKIKGSKVLVLNGLQKQAHISHFTLQQALEMIEIINPEKAYLTHISHRLGLHREIEKELPENVELAYDGLKLNI